MIANNAFMNCSKALSVAKSEYEYLLKKNDELKLELIQDKSKIIDLERENERLKNIAIEFKDELNRLDSMEGCPVKSYFLVLDKYDI